MRKTINRPVFITSDNEVYVLNSVFKYDDDFKGATGGVLVPVSQNEVDERNDYEYLGDIWGYLWEEAVERGDTEDSKEDYLQMVFSDYDGFFFCHDESDCYHDGVQELLIKFDDTVCFECIGGGRCFDKKILESAVEILDQELFDLIKAYEGIE